MTNSSEYNQWRLISNGGIRYRFLGMAGDFDSETGDVSWRAMIRSEDFIAFALELFPPTQLSGNLAYTVAGKMPGWPNMVARKLTFKALDGETGGLPCDALQTDVAAPAGTYHGFLEVTVRFGSGNSKSPDPDDPRTFLEVTSSTGGEFIYSPPGNMKLEEETNSTGSADEAPGDPAINAETGKLEGTLVPGTREPNRNPVLPSVILVPTTEWNVRWKAVPSDYFRNYSVHRLRYLNGRVNSSNCQFLYHAAPETLLFAGFDHQEVFSWKDANLVNPPIDLDLKIIEKRVIWKGVVCGHNHVWSPGLGWRRAWIGQNNDEPLYRHADFNFLFKI